MPFWLKSTHSLGLGGLGEIYNADWTEIRHECLEVLCHPAYWIKSNIILDMFHKWGSKGGCWLPTVEKSRNFSESRFSHMTFSSGWLTLTQSPNNGINCSSMDTSLFNGFKILPTAHAQSPLGPVSKRVPVFQTATFVQRWNFLGKIQISLSG